MANILLVEDEHNARQVLSMGLESMGHMITACDGVGSAEQALLSSAFDVVITDLHMEHEHAGLDVVRMASKHCPQASVLLLTAYASAETAVEAMREGAFDYLTKPVSTEELSDAVERALHASLDTTPIPEEDEVRVESNDILIGNSPIMQRVKDRLLRACKRDFTVLISGESGTGKELAARMVHQCSARNTAAFVPVHCGAIPENLFESELFGHEKGAFTGADIKRVGLVESAHGGTLFLDEIGEMPLNIQVKLLRVLQEKTFRPVGSNQEKPVDVRIIAATNRDLADEVKQGRFREDLFYRLNVVPVHMPALRQRREDIPDLVHVLIQHAGGGFDVSEACMKRLMQLPLLGNVRELENVLQRLMVLSDHHTLDASLLDDFYTPAAIGSVGLDDMHREGCSLDQVLENMERALLTEALAETGGNATQAAKLLNISFRSMRYRMKKLGMKDA